MRPGKPLTIKFQLKNADGRITQIKSPLLIKWLAPVKGNQLSGIPGKFGDGAACDSYGWEDGMLVYRWNTTADMAGFTNDTVFVREFTGRTTLGYSLERPYSQL